MKKTLILPLFVMLVLTPASPIRAAQQAFFSVRSGTPVGGVTVLPDAKAVDGGTARLLKEGQGVSFSGLPKATKLAVRYASLEAGTLSILINDQPAKRIHVHSSGSLEGSFLQAVVDIEIQAGAKLTVTRLAGDPAQVDPDKGLWLVDGKWQPWKRDACVALDGIAVGDAAAGFPTDIWNLPPLPVAEGPYPPDWKGLARRYVVPAWWREAKFGAWAHWDPQSMPEQGDWYALHMYEQGRPDYEFHSKTFGHPSEYGYKDICHHWEIDRWKPEEMMDLFVDMGARYFMAMGVHHDNFDCWDSAFQPWNSVRVGPKRDIVGTWAGIARAKGLRFGIGFHNTPGRTWGQFTQPRYDSDKTGPKAGVPYDAMLTILDGKGKWWEGLDPVDLYGYPHRGNEVRNSPFANQFMWRVDDAISKYHPDLIYFDDHAGDAQVDLGIHMGLGFLAPSLAANFYNKSLSWNHGKMDVVLNLKGVGGHYDSFKNRPEMVSLVERSLVKSSEAVIEPTIMAYPFQTEMTIAPWHYQKGQSYTPADKLIGNLVENVCRNGSMLLNITQHGRGDLDPEVVTICRNVGAWLRVNGEAIYGSRPFEVMGGEKVRYTRNQGFVYATVLGWPYSNRLTLPALHLGGPTIGTVSRVEVLGSPTPLSFQQDSSGLNVEAASLPKTPLDDLKAPGVAAIRVLKITHDRAWINDDDPGTSAPGWQRRVNLGHGDYNDDLTTSETTGDAMTCSCNAQAVTVVCPKEKGAGKIEVLLDGESRGIFDLSTDGDRLAQQRICTIKGLAAGAPHTITLINRGGGVAVDAFIPE